MSILEIDLTPVLKGKLFGEIQEIRTAHLGNAAYLLADELRFNITNGAISSIEYYAKSFKVASATVSCPLTSSHQMILSLPCESLIPFKVS